MEKVIKKAIEGGWNLVFRGNSADKGSLLFTEGYRHIRGLYNGNHLFTLDVQCVTLDPLFWQALGKACGWGKICNCEAKSGVFHSYDCLKNDWKYVALHFHEMNLTAGWDKAVEYLVDLIEKPTNGK